jgi:hypothetical protein
VRRVLHCNLKGRHAHRRLRRHLRRYYVPQAHAVDAPAT